MNFLKRFVSTVISAAALMCVLAVPAAASGDALAPAYSLTGEELVERIEQTYDDALRLAGRRSFNGKCSTMVNCSAQALGIVCERPRLDGHGRDAYDRYGTMGRTDGGYDTVSYSGSEYGLEAALNAVCEDGTRDVYNLVVGFHGGRTANSSSYGHALFIHGILDGVVYFSESYGLYLGGQFYAEGEPIVCTVAEFAEYYNKWAYFEGVVHLDFPDETAPAISRLAVADSSEEGFTLRCRATDNMGIVEMYVRVWPYGTAEEDAQIIPVTNANGAVVVRIDTELFGGFDGRYFVEVYAVDRKGNETVITHENGISLYQVKDHQATYRIRGRSAGVYNAPYVQVNGAYTRESAIPAGQLVDVVGSFVNDHGESWYLLSDGGWIQAERARRVVSCWADLWDLMTGYFRAEQV